MRLMILRAALFAADADLAAGAPEVQTSAPQPHGLGSEEGDPTRAPGERAEEANVTSHPTDPVPSDPSASSSSSSLPTGAARIGSTHSLRELKPELCMPVIVRQKGVLAAGIVVEEDQGLGVSVQIFRGDHHLHAAHRVPHADPAGTDDGWFYPWERDPMYATQTASAPEEPEEPAQS